MYFFLFVAYRRRQVSVRMRVAVVTGSNKGIGLGVVRALCRQYQGEVFLTSRHEARGREAVASLNREGLHPRYHVLDIEEEESVLKLRDHIVEVSYGLIRGINCVPLEVWGVGHPGQQCRRGKPRVRRGWC